MNSSLHDAYAADYDRQVGAYDCYLAEALFGLCYDYIRPGQRLLDLGIGSGLAALPFAKAGLQVQGMDFAPAMLEVCRAKGFAAELKQHDLQQTPWPYPSQAFDHLICCGVLHFIPELETIFSEAARLLPDGGSFGFTAKALTSADARLQKYNRLAGGELEVFEHSPEYIQAVFEQAGFQRRKVMRCFVGQDVFSAWVVQKTTLK
jgi:predicted TPR repeat methyltransferase